MPGFDPTDHRRTFNGRVYQPKTLNSRHHEILRLALLGMPHVEIARTLGITPTSVSNVVNSGLGRQQLSLLNSVADNSALETAQKIREIAPSAIQTIQELMQNEDMPAAVRLSAAKDVLDRAGFVPQKRLSVESTSINLKGDDLEKLKTEALLRARENGLVIDTSSVPKVSTQPPEACHA